jgi:hypothetical protein
MSKLVCIRVAVASATVLFGYACSNAAAPAAPDPVVHLKMFVAGSLRSVMLVPGDSIGLNVHPLDKLGNVVPGRSVDLISRDTVVAYLDVNKVVHAAGIGSTFIVGSLIVDGQPLSDSLMVTVALRQAP